MDNASFHKRIDIQTAILEAGHILEYLPPYSPDFNPIEHKWAQAKAHRKQLRCSLDQTLFIQYPLIFYSAFAISLLQLLQPLLNHVRSIVASVDYNYRPLLVEQQSNSKSLSCHELVVYCQHRIIPLTT